jgi:hypothetical protein
MQRLERIASTQLAYVVSTDSLPLEACLPCPKALKILVVASSPPAPLHVGIRRDRAQLLARRTTT